MMEKNSTLKSVHLFTTRNTLKELLDNFDAFQKNIRDSHNVILTREFIDVCNFRGVVLVF